MGFIIVLSLTNANLTYDNIVNEALNHDKWSKKRSFVNSNIEIIEGSSEDDGKKSSRMAGGDEYMKCSRVGAFVTCMPKRFQIDERGGLFSYLLRHHINSRSIHAFKNVRERFRPSVLVTTIIFLSSVIHIM